MYKQQNKKIIGILVHDISQNGGLEVVSLRLVKTLSMDYAVYLFTLKNNGKYTDDKVNVINIGLPHDIQSLDDTQIRAITSKINEMHIEVLFVQLNSPVSSFIMACENLYKFINDETGCRVYVCIHNSPKSFLKNYLPYKPSLYNICAFIYVKLKLNFILNKATIKFIKNSRKYIDAYLSLSDGCRSELLECYNENSIVAYNPIMKNDDAVVRPKKKQVIFVGRLESTKNVLFLVEAWHRACNKEWTFVIVGDGTDRRKIEKYINKHRIKNIVLKGWMPENEALGLIGESAVLLMASMHEGFPNVITEAMSLRTVVLTTKYDGISYELLNPQNSIVCNQNIKEYSLNLCSLMERTDLKEMQDSAYEAYIDYYNRSVKSYDDLVMKRHEMLTQV